MNFEIRKLSGRMLIIDDSVMNVRLLERMLQCAGCTDYFSTTDPRQAMDLCATVKPDVVLLDWNMPFIDGFTLLGMLGERFPCRITMPIVVLTADATNETKHRALQAGATDFLTKPIDALELVLRLGNLLDTKKYHLEAMLGKERTWDLEKAQDEIIERLAAATELRDDDTGGHVERVATMTGKIAEAMGINSGEVDLIRRAVRLHDVGKISVPDSILLKKGPLTPDEMDLMREHTTAGGRILHGSRFPVLIFAEQIARHHHERWDGTGYPDRLSGEKIPLCARIAAVADVFDALTSKRPYKEAWCTDAAVAEIVRQSGAHFDPKVIDAFCKVVGYETESERRQELLRAA